MEPIFKKDPPEKNGFYWWKESEASEPEVVRFEVGIETSVTTKYDSHTIYQTGTDVPIGGWMGNGLGLFGSEVTLTTESQEDENELS